MKVGEIPLCPLSILPEMMPLGHPIFKLSYSGGGGGGGIGVPLSNYPGQEVGVSVMALASLVLVKGELPDCGKPHSSRLGDGYWDWG